MSDVVKGGDTVIRSFPFGHATGAIGTNVGTRRSVVHRTRKGRNGKQQDNNPYIVIDKLIRIEKNDPSYTVPKSQTVSASQTLNLKKAMNEGMNE